MAAAFLGRGWRVKLGEGDELGLGIEPDPEDPSSNRVAEAPFEEAVRQSIWIILSTAPGERVGRPDFGCKIHDLTFSTNGAELMGAVQAAVRSALAAWERRINVLSIDVLPHEREDNLLLVDLSYTITATNSRFNLVYPFYVT